MSRRSSVAVEGFVPWPADVVEAYRARGVWTDETFSHVLHELARRHAQRLAVVDARRRLTYAELCARAEALARGLRRRNIRFGDAVLVQLPNRIELLEVCFALFQLGARPVMAQPAHRRLELVHFANKTRAVAHVVVDRQGRFDYRALSQQVRRECPSLRETWVVGDAADDTDLESLFAEDEDPLPQGPRFGDIALFQLSGGSTNLPKLIARTHADYLYSVRRSVEVCGFDFSTVYLAVLPVAHNFPLSSPGALGALCAGGVVVLSESAAAEEAFAWIEKERVTVTSVVPSLLPSWSSAARRGRMRLESLSWLQVGGAKLPEALARRIEPELGCKLQQVFGMAEGLVCYTRHDDPEDRIMSSQGRPMSPYDEVRVVDDDDRPVGRGCVGHLLTRGPYTIRGYYDAPEHNAATFTPDGFYRTGDRVRQLEDGSLVVEGRAKDQINRGGEKIAAPEVEEQLCAHPRVDAAALVPIPDPYLGERSCAFVVASEPLRRGDLVAHLKERGLAAYKVPDRFEWLGTMPKTPVGKIDKRRLSKLAADLASQRGPTHARAEARR